MKKIRFPALARFLAALSLTCLACPSPARADTVASLLGNFTINQFCELTTYPDQMKIHFVVVFGQLPALRELHLADSNADGVTTPEERDAYLAQRVEEYARNLHLSVDGANIPLTVERLSSSLPSEQAGFSLRFDAEFVGPVLAATNKRRVEFVNSNYQGKIGWHELQVTGQKGTSVFDGDAYVDSLTGGLSVNPKALPPDGPLDEREAHFSFVNGPIPPGMFALKERPVAFAADAATPMPSGEAVASPSNSNWLPAQTKRLLSMLSAPTVSLQVKILALLGALVLGALHAFSPGHGKTVVGAYLIGSRGTPRHAVFLGLIVTITHTLGVFFLGFATLFAAHYVVPEKLFPIISLVSGILVVGIGGSLLVQRINEQRRNQSMQFVQIQPPTRGTWALAPVSIASTHHHPHLHDHNGHAHVHDRALQDGTVVHSHGGTTHSHLPAQPGERITWRGLLALGVSGGLIPCPSAMVLLLAAVALNKTALGLLLVVAFSVGLAATLTLVGLAFLYARRLFPRLGNGGRWARGLPIASAALITVVGIVISYNALFGKIDAP